MSKSYPETEPLLVYRTHKGSSAIEELRAVKETPKKYLLVEGYYVNKEDKYGFDYDKIHPTKAAATSYLLTMMAEKILCLKQHIKEFRREIEKVELGGNVGKMYVAQTFPNRFLQWDDNTLYK